MAGMDELFLLKKYFGHVETECKDHITEYKDFLQKLVDNADPNDELPVRVAQFRFTSTEIAGAVINWSKQYLEVRDCPPSILTALIRSVVKNVFEESEDDLCADPSAPSWNSIKFMQTVIKKLVKVCEEYLHSDHLLQQLPPPLEFSFPVSKCSFKNVRRTMEDRFCVAEDLNGLFGLKDSGSISFYGVYDGHAGIDAAEYSAAYLHQYLTESSSYPNDLKTALKDAFLKTDQCVLTFPRSSGTTAVCAVVDHQESMLHVAWAGDSEAVISMNGKAINLVEPHKASRPDELERVTKAGGEVLFYDMCWRIKGRLAVSRAIGDKSCKPYVCADPDYKSVPLDGTEEFLILASDGLWDVIEDKVAVFTVLMDLLKGKDPSKVAESLTNKAKFDSKDNITVLVVFLKPPEVIAQSHSLKSLRATAMEDEWIAHQKNHGGSFFFEPSNNMAQMAGGGMGCMVNNGGLGMDFGPETDVDSVDNHPLNHDNNNGTSDSNDNVDFVLNNKLAAANTEIKSEFIKDVNNSKLIAEDNSVKEGVKSSTKVELDEEEEDDDEEWAYRKGEEDKIELSPSPKVSVLDNIQVDDMDHPLNPNAAEFVPTSPVDKNSSKFATNNGLSNKVPLSTTDCKSAFTTDSSEGFSSNEIDLESARSNHENTTNGTEKETIDVNSFKVIKDSENSIEESETSVLNKNGHDRLSPVDDFPCNMASTPFKSNSSIESFLPNLNTKNHDLEKDNDSALDGNRVDNSFGDESTLYSEISTEKSHEFSDAITPSVLKDLSAISPEKPHEFSDSTALLSGDNLSMVNHPNSSAVLDPVNAFDDSKYVTCGNPDVSSLSTNNESSTVGTPSELNFDVSGVDTLVDDSQDSKVDSKKSNHSFYGNSNVSHQISQNGLFSNETPEMNKFDVSQLDHLLYVGTGASEINKSDESQLDHLLHVGTMKKDSLLSRSIDEVVDEPESSLLSSEALKNNTKSISAEVENSSHENIETCADSTSGNTGFPIEGESLKVGITSEFGSTSASEMNTIDAIISNVSNPVETSSEVEDFEINKETNFESTNESLKPVDSLLNSESNETIEQNKTSDESTTNAKDAFDELVSTTQNFGADLFKNENIGAVPVSEVCARSDHNPFSSSIKEKSESAAFSGLENFDYTTSVISEHSEKLDEFKIDDEIHQEAPEEQKLTNDFTCYREKAPEFETSPEADKSNQDISALNNANDAACDVFSAGMSDEFNGLSKNMENLKIEDGKSPLVSNEDSNFELSETKLAMQNNQAEISQLVDDSEFGNSVDVVNKLTEEFESSMIQDSAITAESVGTAVAASAAVGAIAVAAATDKAKKSATSPAAKKAAPKVGAKTLDVKSKVSTASKPATSAQPLTKPATKSPALTSKKPIPPKASPAKTSSTVTRTNPSLIMKSKVAATVPPASSVARSKPSTSTASTKPRTTLAPTRTALSTSTSSTARPKTAPATTTSVTKSTAKPLTNGIAPRVTSTLKRPTTASSTSSKVSAAPTKTTATAPRPLPRAAVSTARTTTTKASTAASSVSSKPTTAPQRRPISGISRLPSDKKDKEITNNQILARTTNNGPRTTTLRKLDSKKTAASQSNAASKTTPETKPPPIKRMPPKAVVSLVEDVAQKEETVVTNGNVNSEDISVNES